MKRIFVIISTAIFALIYETGSIPSTDTQSDIREYTEYNIVDFEKDTQVCAIDLEPPKILVASISGSSYFRSKISGLGDFCGFARNSKIWVDKSLLAERIVNATDRVILITAPRKWGKSLNLNMLKYIFENSSKYAPTEADFISQFFTKQAIVNGGEITGKVMCKPLISTRTDFMEKYFQKYPVIDLDFRECSSRNWRGVFVIKVSQVYMKHCYLLNHLHAVATDQSKPLDTRNDAEKMIVKFTKYMQMSEGDIGDGSLQNSIAWLCQNLYEAYGKKCFVFIDEFDALQNYLIFCNRTTNEAGTEAIEFMRTFYSMTFKNPEKSGIEKAVLTGIIRSAKSTLLSGVPRYYDLNSVNMSKFAPFYGFTPSEVEAIMYHEKPESFQNYFREATTWYDGYGSVGLWNGSTFNAWDIMRYIDYFISKPYWEETGSIEVLVKLLSYDFFEEIIYAALDPNEGYMISASSLQNVNESTLRDIHELLTNAEDANWYQYVKNEGRIEQLENAIVQLALQAGYLSVRANLGSDSLKKMKTGSMQVPVIVPNLHLRCILQNARISSIMKRYNHGEYMQDLESSVGTFALWFELDVLHESEGTLQSYLGELESEWYNLNMISSYDNRGFADLRLPKFSNMTAEQLRQYVHQNEAAVRRTIAPVLEKFRVKSKCTMKEVGGFKEFGKLDTQLVLDDKLLIIDYNCDLNCKLGEVLDRAVNRTPLTMLKKSRKFKWIKFLLINFELYPEEDDVPVLVQLHSRWVNGAESENE